MKKELGKLGDWQIRNGDIVDIVLRMEKEDERKLVLEKESDEFVV